MEPGRDRNDGVAALSLAISILRPGWSAQLSVISTQRGFIPRRAIQYRLLFAADDDGCPGLQPKARRFRSHLWRSAFGPKPHRPTPGTTHSRVWPVTANAIESRGKKHSGLQIRRFRL